LAAPLSPRGSSTKSAPSWFLIACPSARCRAKATVDARETTVKPAMARRFVARTPANDSPRYEACGFAGRVVDGQNRQHRRRDRVPHPALRHSGCHERHANAATIVNAATTAATMRIERRRSRAVVGFGNDFTGRWFD
jgi:hypothetical protein